MQKCISHKSKSAYCYSYAEMHKESMASQRDKHLDFINEIMSQLGLSASGLATKAKKSPSTLNRFVRDESYGGLNTATLDAIANVAGYQSYEDYLDNRRSYKPKLLPVVGYVGAGSEIYPIDDHAKGAALEEIETPHGMNVNGYVGVRVRGDSMFPRYMDGEILLYKRNCDWDDSYINQECIVKLADGRMFVKMLRKGAKPNLYTLESHNAPPIYDVQIEWACPTNIKLGKFA